jgi:hypothetical protein
MKLQLPKNTTPLPAPLAPTTGPEVSDLPVVEVNVTLTTRQDLEDHIRREKAMGFELSSDRQSALRTQMTYTMGAAGLTGGIAYGSVPTTKHVVIAPRRVTSNAWQAKTAQVSVAVIPPDTDSRRLVEGARVLRSEADLWVHFADREAAGFPVSEEEQQKALELHKLQGWVRGVTLRYVGAA